MDKKVSNTHGLLELDEQIIALIEQNGRITYRDIAKALGISERQATTRLRSLISNGVIRMITVVNAFAVGFKLILAIGVEVADRATEEVAEELAQLPNVISVGLMTGQYDIEFILAVESHARLSSLVTGELAAIAGIRTLHPSLFLNVFKYETGSGPVNSGHTKLTMPRNSRIKETDRLIIERLWKNASETNESIASAIGVSEATVRKRIGRLRQDDIIHITAMRNVTIGEDVVFAIIGIELSAGQYHNRVVKALCQLRQVHVVANVLGRYDIIAQVLISSTSELSGFLSQEIAPIPGIRNINCTQAMKAIKFDDRWRLIGPYHD